MTQLRERWEGVSLPGDYLLQQWLSGDDAAGFFETSLAPDGRRAIVKLVPEFAGDGAAQLALWQRTRSLRHPNLRELLDCGHAELAGEIAVYAVFEYADDTLASALGQSPLSEAEAREVLDAAINALGYLQAQGLAHPEYPAGHARFLADIFRPEDPSARMPRWPPGKAAPHHSVEVLQAVTEMAASFGGWGRGMSGPLDSGVRDQDGGLAGVYL